MSDCEKTDFFWESWTSPGKRKRKKESKKNNKGPTCKSNTTMKTNESFQKKKKKKKKTKFKEVMEERKNKKKEKNKNKMSLDSYDSFVFMCNSSAAASAAQAKPEALDPRSSTKKLQPDHMTQDSKKKTKRRKKVMFEQPPGYIRVKRPKFVSSTPQRPKASILSEEEEAVRDRETGQSRGQPRGDESQCTADDINSQDLFITQKTFRRSPSDASSGEASDKAINPTPKKKTDRVLTEGSHKANWNHKKEKWSPPMGRDLNTNLIMEKHVSCPSSQQASSYLLQTHGPSLIPRTSKASISTQTENFFTTELSSFLLFCQKSALTIGSEALKPLDLSLPQKVRKDLCSCVSVKMSLTEHKEDEEKCGDQNPSHLQDEIKRDGGAWPSCSSEGKKASCGRQPWSDGATSKGETIPSPQSESEHKSADTTTSSEDNEQLWRSSKAELIQVKVVQTRLNESFFFKTKGEGQSPRPESPLMKIAQNREMKSRKGRWVI